jgi:2-dehydropantoate 2-reductase
MDICVFGAGALGGNLASCLAETGAHRVSIITRGAHLAAIRERGLEFSSPGKATRRVVFAAAEDSARRLPPQDIVFVTLKAHSLPTAAADICALLKPDGHAVFVTNGIPWWWHYRTRDSRPQPMRVDPNGELWKKLHPSRALGGVAYSGNVLKAPGVVVHLTNNRWTLGEPTNERSPRLAATVELMNAAGLNAEASTDLRGEVVKKLIRNASLNPMAALTRLSADRFYDEPTLVELGQQLMNEIVNVVRAKGYNLPDNNVNEVIRPGGVVPVAGGASIKGAKASMLQDALSGRPMEVEALVGQVQQFAREENVATPALDIVYALLRGLNHTLEHPEPAESTETATR